MTIEVRFEAFAEIGYSLLWELDSNHCGFWIVFAVEFGYTLRMTISYTPRILDSVLKQRIRHHPAILIVGPRAAGKTTTAERLANTTIRLDRPGEATALRADPDATIRDLEEPVLIDEWQIVPEVLAAVKRTVDQNPKPGRFLITGSVRGELDSPTWPGTGRLLRIPMYGLTVSEIRESIPDVPLLDRLSEGYLSVLASPRKEQFDLRDYVEIAVRGGFPEPALRLPDSERGPWLDSYLDLLLSRDVEELSAHPESHLLRRYLEAYAANTAGVVSQHTLYSTAGIAKATGERYEDLLQRLLIVETVPAWWTNRLKRLTKAPKRYLVDPSLALAALRVDTMGLLRDGDLLGRILDTLVMSQLRAELPRCDSRARIFHLRQEQGRHEVDIIIEYGGGRIIALEIKATSAPDLRDARHLVWLREELGPRFLGGAVLHTGSRTFDLEEKIFAAPIAAVWN